MPSDHSVIRLLIARRSVGYTCHLEVDDSATAEDSIYGPENAGPATHMLSCSPRDAVGEVVGALEEFCHSVVKSSEFSSLRLGDVKLFTTNAPLAKKPRVAMHTACGFNRVAYSALRCSNCQVSLQ